MKEDTNKELDLLLRRLSRRQNGVVPDVGSNFPGEHLDADELSSYAENVLPVAARARYTEHLAECARCREIMVQLSSAAGVIAADQTTKVPAPSGLRNFLASLFSPMVLRYAVPAVGLILVAAIAFFVVNDRRNASDVASSKAPQPAAPNSGAFVFDNSNSNREGLVGRTNAPQAPAAAKSTAQNEAPAPVPNAPPSVDITAEVKKDAPAKEREEDVASAAYAPPVTKREAKPQPTVNDFTVDIQTSEAKINTQTTDLAKLEREKTADQAQKAKPAEQPKAEGRTENKATDSVTASAAPATGAGAGAANRRARPGVTPMHDGVERDDAAVRMVAGRQFRRERNIWIDTAYSGGATTNLARGSEQYRALIADEPAIKNIADQLGGEFIVVWKSRAYRIR